LIYENHRHHRRICGPQRIRLQSGARFLRQDYTVYPVNPKEKRIEGLPVFKSIADVPVRPNHPAHVPALCSMQSVPKCQPKETKNGLFTGSQSITSHTHKSIDLIGQK
jgi:hypothetical protein